MGYAENIRLLFIVITMIVIGTVSIVRVGTIDLHAILTTAAILVPAIVVMGYLGQKIGEIVDNPKNRADADYKIAVLNALKKMDKSITLQELNEKLTKQVAEPDLPEPPEDDIDVYLENRFPFFSTRFDFYDRNTLLSHFSFSIHFTNNFINLINRFGANFSIVI